MDPLLKENLITTKDASELSGYTSDYLARLVRSGEITGKKIGHSWLVNTASLEIFLDTQKSFKSERARELANSRVKEYRLRHELAERASRDLTKKISVPSKMGHPMSEIGLTHVSLRSHLLALSSAFAVVIMGANLASAEVLPSLAGRVASIAEEVSSGFNETFGDLPSHLTSKFNAIHEAMQENVSRVATANTIASAQLASPLLSDPDLSYLQMTLGENTDNENTRTRVATSLGGPASKLNAARGITREDVLTFADDAFRFVTSPAQIVSTLTHTYVAIGYDAYALINSSLASYRSLIEQSGEKVLALAATTRDTLATAPRRISKMNLALGSAVIDATHTAIRAEVTLAYSPGIVAPEISRTTVALMSTVGDALMRGTIATPTIAKMAFLRATEAPSHIAPALAEAVFSAEYAGALRFVALTTRVTDRYALALHSLGEAGYTGAVGTRSLANATMSFIEHAPIAIEDAYLGALGKSALALDTIAHTSPVAAVFVASAPALSEGEKIALATYRGIHGIFETMTSALAVLFTPSPLAVSPPPTTPEKKVTTTTTPSTSRTTSPTRTTSYPTYTTVVQGVSPELMDQSLAALRLDVFRAIAANTVSTIITRFSDARSDGVFNGGIFDSGSLTNGISVTATNGTFTNLSGGTTNLATTTITGDLTVSGTMAANTVSVTDHIKAPYFVATSTTATSTFAGSINIDNGGFVYATSTRNIGIGILSPAALLALQNSTSTQPIFVANNAAGAEVYRITDNGFVGIGTTTPGYALAVEGSSSLGNQAIAGYFTATTSTATSTFAGSLAVGTSSPWGNGLFVVGTSSPLLYVEANTGRIGLGTTSPESRLAIFDTGTQLRLNYDSSNYSDFAVASDGALSISPTNFATTTIANALALTMPQSYFLNNGKVGFGTLTPSAALEIATTSTQLRLAYDATNYTNFIIASDGALAVTTTNSGTTTVTNAFSAASSLYVLNNGNVGINTLAPEYKLDVNGTIRSVGDAFFNSNVALGNATNTDITYFNSRIGTHLVPTVDNVSDIGDGTNWLRWRTGYFGTSVGIGGMATTTANSLTFAGAGNITMGTASTIQTLAGGLTMTGAAGLNLNSGTGALMIDATGQVISFTGAATTFNTSTFALNNTGAITIGTHGSEQNITFETNNFDINSTGAVTLDGTNFTYTPTGTYTVNSTGAITEKTGSTYNLYATSSVAVLSDSTIDLTGTGMNLTSSNGNIILTYPNGKQFQLTDGTTRIETLASGELVLGDTSANTTIDGLIISLSGNTVTTGTITNNITDNTSDSYLIREGSNNYISINTSNGSEGIAYGNATTNPTFDFLGSGALTVTGNVFLNSNVTLGDATNTDITYFNSRIGTHLVPTVDNVSDLGDPTNWLRWRTGYFGTSVGIAGTATSTGISLLASGAYLIDSASPLSLNTTHNQNVLFGTGKVGMGVAVPTYTLDVSGNAHFTSYVDASHFIATSTTATSTFIGGFVAGNNAAFAVNQGSPANSLYVTTGGNVGIGTTDPGENLDVAGNVRVSNCNYFSGTDGSGGTNQIAGICSGITFLGNVGGSQTEVQLMTGGSTRMTILPSTGNVGIGTTTPYSRLSVWGAGTGATSMFELTNSASTSLMTVLNNGNIGLGIAVPTYTLDVAGNAHFTSYVDASYFVATSTTATSTFIGGFVAGNNAAFAVNQGSPANSLYVTTGGNVGINTLAPAYKLDVNGTIRSVGDAFFNSNVTLGDATNTDITYFNSRIGTHLVPTIDNVSDIGDGTNWLRWRTGYFGTSVGIAGTATSTGASLLASGAYLIDSASPLSLNTTHNQNVLFGTGNIGLGIAVPTYTLDVAGNAHFTSYVDASYFVATSTTATSTFIGGFVAGNNAAFAVNQGSPANSLYVTTGGNVGINTLAPAYKLDVNGTFRTVADAFLNANTTVGGTLAQTGLATFTNGFLSNASSTITTGLFSMNGGASTTNITASGIGYFGTSVGIGTTSPFAKLSVAGNGYFDGTITASAINATSSISAPYFTATSATATSTFAGGLTVGTNKLFVSNYSGNVGIGTTTPAYKLDVNGDFRVGVAGANANSLYVKTSTGNVGIGTTVPGQLLSLESATPIINIKSTGSANERGLKFEYKTDGFITGSLLNYGSTGETRLSAGSPGSSGYFLTAYTDGAERMRITNGNVGIGTTSPSTTLSVQGNQYVSGTSFFGGAITGTSTLAITGTGNSYILGNVGIGTTTPTVRFSVGGAAGDTTGHGYFTGGLGVGVVNTVAGTLQTLGAATFGGNTTVGGTLTQSGLATFTNGFLSNASSTITTGLFSMNGGASTTNITASGNGYFTGALSANSLTLSTALTVANGGTGVTTITGLVKGNGSSAFTAAVPSFDYVGPGTTVNGHLLSSNVSVALSELSDATVTAPAVDQILKWNGMEWINGAAGTTNAGSGVDFFYTSSSSDVPPFDLLQKSPDPAAEVNEYTVVNNSTATIDTYLSSSGGIGSVQIDSGVWTFNTYATSSSAVGTNTLTYNVYKRTSGGSETFLFAATSTSITSATPTLIQTQVVQPAFVIDPTDRLEVKVRGTTDNGTDTTISFIHSGNLHYSFINTPLIVRHNDLAGIQGGASGQDYHLSLEEYTGTGTGTFVRQIAPTVTESFNIAGAAGGIANIFSISTSTIGFATTTALTVDQYGNLSLSSGANLSVAGTGVFDGVITANAGIVSAGTISFTGTNHAGLKINNLTTLERDALTPASGMTIFNTTVSKMQVYNGLEWKNVGNPEIGAEVTAGTAGSVLFVDASGNLGQDNANFFWDQTNRRLGLGTTTPFARFSLAGASGAGTPLFAISTSTTGFATTTALMVDQNGNLSLLNGAGLTVSGTTAFTGLTTFNGGFLSNASSTITSGLFSMNGGASTTQLTTTGSTYLATTGGNVGIGTTGPTNKLQVAFSDNQTSAGTLTSAAGLKNTDTTNGNYSMLAFQSQDTGGTAFAGGRIGAKFTSHAVGAGVASLIFDTVDSGTYYERMRIDSLGNVGIGTTTPSAKLAINLPSTGLGMYLAGYASGTGALFSISTSTASATTTAFQIDNNGNLSLLNGAGLTVSGTTAYTGLATFTNGFLSNASSTITSGLFSMNGGASTTQLTTTGATYLATLGGNVGIGPMYGMIPQSLLTLYSPDSAYASTKMDFFSSFGTGARVNAGRIYTRIDDTDSYSSARLTLASPTGANTWIDVLSIKNGNAGIGTTTPAYKLDVAGFINTDQYSGYLQGGQLLAYASSTNQDTIFGLGAGGQNATTSAGVSGNTAFGYNALNAKTTGSYNTANGTQALYSDTTGSQNTANGRQALYSNTTGTGNVANGLSALRTNTTGNQNTANGLYSLYSNTTGSNNIANGYYSLYYNATGSYNTATGYKSLYNVTTGYDNIALGHTENTGGNNITTGYNNILLGYNTVGTTTSSSNFLNIGNSFFGTMVATSSATSLPQDFTGVSFGIATSTPGARFAIGGTAGASTPLFMISTSTSTFATTTALTVDQNGNLSLLNGANFSVGGNLTITGTQTYTGLATFTNGFLSNASSTITSGLFSMNGGASTTQLTTTGGTYLATTGGNVGVGTASPAYKLDVAGFINTDQYSGYLQGGQLLAYASSTNKDTIFGFGAGGQNATTSATVKGNTAIGYQALNAMTTGSYNNAIGYQAMGNGIVTGTNNNALGYQALTNITSGGNNNAFGYASLDHITSGSYNTGLGYETLLLADVASYNTAIGYQTGYNVSTGYDNIMLGHEANTGGNNITTGYNNILLGYNTVGTTTSSSNFLNIGNSFFGTMVATSTSTSLPTTMTGISFAIATSSFTGNTLSVQNSSTLNNVVSFYSNAGASLFEINDNGNVGVASTTPFGRLSVDTSSLAAGVPSFVVGSFTRTDLIVTQAGNIGIGTTNPLSPLSVTATAVLPVSTGTGGNTITTSVENGVTYKIHTFTSGGTFTPPAGVTSVEYLVVAGGGSGGSLSGGGGAGGFRTGTVAVSAGANTVTVGAGGIGDNPGTNNGENSVFSTITSLGGGAGGAWANSNPTGGENGVAGGSGGGSSGYVSGSAYTGGAGTSGQGHDGGSGVWSGASYAGAGGGGAGAVGFNSVSKDIGGDGGAGTASSISGSSVTYAGGGGGGVDDAGTAGGAGGAGGGGGGSKVGVGTAGTANTGGGGGGSRNSDSGGNGGSGIVIIRYAVSSGASEQLRLSYDASNYNSFTVDSTGNLTIAANGTNSNITLTPAGTGYTILNGNVGIGTTSPATKLSVQGNGYFSGTGFFGGAITGTSTLAITGTGDSYILGNVGIGTTSPFALLALAGTAGGSTNLIAISTSTAGFATTTALTVDQNGNLSLLNGANFSVGGNLTITGTQTYSGLATFTNGFLSNASSTITSGLFSMSGGASTTQLTTTGSTYLATLGGKTTIGSILGTPNGLLNLYEDGNTSLILDDAAGGDPNARSWKLLSDGYNLYFNISTAKHGGTFTNKLTLDTNGLTLASGLKATLPFASTTQITSTGSTYLATTGGNVGIGTTSPTVKFSVGGAAGDTTGHGYFTGGLGVGVVNTTAGTLQTSGNATIGGALTLGTDLSVTNGGTGVSTFTSGQLLYGNGTDALSSVATTSATLGLGLTGSLTTINNVAQSLTIATSSLYSGAANALSYFTTTNTLGSINAGTNGYVLAMSGGTPTWVASTTLANISGTLAVTNGGTGASTLTGCLTGNGTGAITGSGSACAAGTVTSVGLSSSGSLTIGSTPVTTSGTLTANLNMANANTWTALQTFGNASTTLISSTVGWTGKLSINGNGATDTYPLYVNVPDSGAMVLNGPAGVNNSATMKWFAGGVEKAFMTWQDTTNFFRVAPISGGFGFYADNTTGRGMTILTSTGNTGIGDATPSALFTVGSGDLFQVISTGHARGIAGTAGAPAFSFTGDTDTGIYSGGTNILQLVTAGADRVTIDASGNVGIGMTGPSYKLDVAGFINTDQYSGYRMGGNLLAYASSTNQDTIFGLGAGGQNATTSATVGGNTAIGYQSLSGLTSGTYNTALGFKTLAKTSYGGYNTAFGSYAMSGGVVTGAGSNAIGEYALQNLTSGNYNNAVGAYAMGSGTTVTGIENNALGHSAMRNITSGNYNTAIGYGTLYNLTTGTNNTGIGYNAGYNITTGYDNIALGHTENTDGNNITTGYNNILLGYNTVGTTTSSSNFLNIGNSFFGIMNATSSATSLPSSFANVAFAIATSTFTGNTLSVQNSSTLNNVVSFYSNAGASLFEINDNGNVGIGTTTPLGRLSVDTSNLAADVPSFVVGSSTRTDLIITQSGNVGIGTTSPLNKLDIYDSTNDATLKITSGAGSVTGGRAMLKLNAGIPGTGYKYTGINFQSSISTTLGWGIINGYAETGSDNLQFISSFTGTPATRVTFFSTGNVGIGTTSPTSKLSVQGNSYVSGSSFFGGAITATSTLTLSALGTPAGTFLAADANGVLIATTTPANYFTNAGVLTTLATGSQLNVPSNGWYSIGGNLLAYASSTNQDTIFGLGAGGQNATTSATAAKNTAIGYQALNANTTGNNNTAIGYQSLYKNTTGTNNIANGNYSLSNNTTGSNNTANSMYSLYVNSSGSSNTANGYASLYTNSTGSYNIANGYASLYKNTTGSYNTGIGSQAGYNVTTGSYNTGIGSNAGYDINTGYDNIALGHVANTGGNNITTGYNNIMLGYNAGIGTTTSSSNFLNIGNSFFGTMIATTTSTSLPTSFANVAFAIATSTFTGNTLSVQNASTLNNVVSFFSNAGASLFEINDNGNVGIGSTTPWGKLSVELDTTTPGFVVANQGSTTPSFYIGGVNQNGFVGIGTTTAPSLARLIMDSSFTNETGSSNAVAGIHQFFTFSPTVGNTTQVGNRMVLYNNPAGGTATNTAIAQIIRVIDNSNTSNLVRGLDVTANGGSNNYGVNTAIRGSGGTFGLQGFTTALAGGTSTPAAIYGENTGTTASDVLRLYSATMTDSASNFARLYQDSSAFTGTGLLMNFGAGGGSFTGNFMDLQNNGASAFKVSNVGSTIVGSGSSQAGLQIGFGGLCVDNDGSCSVATAGTISAVAYATGHSDLAEVYYSNESLTPGDIVYSKGTYFIGKADTKTDALVLGAVSTNAGLTLGQGKKPLSSQTEYAVGLSGRIPVKVTNENGPIHAGDKIILSSVDGTGMSQGNNGGTVIGIALEDFDGSQNYLSAGVVESGTATVADGAPICTTTSTADAKLSGGGDIEKSSSTNTGTASAVPGEICTQPKVTIVPQNKPAVILSSADGATVKGGQILVFLGLSWSPSIADTIKTSSNGNIGIGTDIANARLTVSGNVFATSYEAPLSPATAWGSQASSTSAVEIPSAVLTADGLRVDLYKLATYNLSGIDTLLARVDAQEVRLTSLETRMNALKSGDISSASGSPISFSTTSLASAFEGLGAYISKGFAQFGTLIADRFVAATNSAGTSSAGTVSMLIGNTVAEVKNVYVTPATKIFVTFNAPVTGSWYVSDKQAGSFRVVLSEAQTADVSFDYFLVQTEGQVATSTPAVGGSLTSNASSESQTSSTASNSDTVAPVITLLGDNPLHLSVGGVFTEPGVSVLDNVDGAIDPIVTFVDGVQMEASATTITTASAKTYTIAYKATDAAKNMSTATRTVIVGTPAGTTTTTTTTASTTASTTPADTTKPVVVLKGAAAMQLTVGDTFTDPGATATDNIDGPITPVASGTVDTTKEGSYSLTYTATDAAGNIGTISRLVSVAVAAGDTTKPVITLNGAAPMQLTVGDTFTDPGATATDNIDGPITPVASGTVDTATAGSYNITYSATDKAGNTGTAGRIVTVSATASDAVASSTPAI